MMSEKYTVHCLFTEYFCYTHVTCKTYTKVRIIRFLKEAFKELEKAVRDRDDLPNIQDLCLILDRWGAQCLSAKKNEDGVRVVPRDAEGVRIPRSGGHNCPEIHELCENQYHHRQSFVDTLFKKGVSLYWIVCCVKRVSE